MITSLIQETEMTSLSHLPGELIQAILKIYQPAGMKLTEKPIREPESTEYAACRFWLNNHNIVFRVAKITPTKVGQFVTTWKRPNKNIVPLDINDCIDFIIVSVSEGLNNGQFIFDRKILMEKNILSTENKGGKLSFRLYPAWNKTESKQARLTQQWQLKYFFSIKPDGTADLSRVCELFNFPKILL